MAESSISLNFLPRPLRKALFDFQKEGVKFGIRKQGRCLIGDEMGLGKTLQAISIAYYYKEAWPLLIVAPSSVKFSWIDEIEKWLPEVEPHNVNLIRSGSDISNLGKALIHIVGYGLLSLTTSKLLLEAMESHKFNIVIIDESHYLKTKCAARTQRLHKLCKKARHAILLSGTPSLARPRELYFQLDIVCPGKFDTFNKFVRRYCDAREVYYRGKRHFDTSGASNLNELYFLLKTHVMIRRLKKEVLTQLPPKRRQKVTFDISESTSKYKKEMQQTLKDFKKCAAILRGDTDSDDLTITSPLQEMRRLSTLLYHYTGLVKIGPVLKYIEDLAQGMDSKFIVFFRHRLVREAIEEKLVTMKIKYICIAGDVPSGIRGELVHSFQTDPKIRVAALSIEAASFGLTLTAAHHVVFAELHHTPGVIIQAEDRAHRIGQTLPVNVHYLIARGTVDEILWSMIRRKVYVTSSTLDGECKELQAEDGDEDQSRQLSACAAWVQEQEEDADGLEDFVMGQLSSKTLKKDRTQRDLRTFFAVTPSSSQSNSLEHTCKDESQCKNSASKKCVEQSLALNSKKNPISVVDSDEDDFSAWDDVDEDILISEVSDSPEIFEEKAPDSPNQACVKNSHNEGNFDAEQKCVEHPEQALKDEQCPLKPRMLKFKKVKDGKFSFTGSNNYTKLHKKESKCAVHVSPLKIVGNDSESESQTLRGYLDEECDGEIFKAERKDDCSEKVVCSAENSRHKDRGFLVSLQEADIECVAVVCKKTSSISQNRCEISGDSDAGEVIEHEFNNEFDDLQHEDSRDSKEKTVSNEIQAVLLDASEKPKGYVCPTVLADSSRGQESELKGTSHDKLHSAQSQCLDDSYSQMETDEKGCTESDVLNRGDFAGKNNRDPGPVASLNRTAVESISHVDVKQNTDKGDEAQKGMDISGGNEGNCNLQKLEESIGSRSVDNSLSSAKGLLQNDTRKENVPNNIALKVASVCTEDDLSDDFQVTSIKNTQVVNPVCTDVEESVSSCGVSSSLSSSKFFIQNDTLKEKAPEKNAGGVSSICVDDDSSDDFQPSSIRNSQMTPPAGIAQNPSKAKKRKPKATKRSKDKTATQEVRNRNNCRKTPVEWSCNACTFINDGQLLECSICLTPRVTSDDSSSTTDKQDSSSESRHGVEMAEVSGVSEVRVEPRDVNSANEIGGQSSDIPKHVMPLEDVNGSEQLPTSNGTRQTIDLFQGAAAHEVLIDSKTVLTTMSRATKNSIVVKEKPSVDDLDSSLLAEPGLPPWSCPACTFLNMSQMIECSICFTPRRRSQRLSGSKRTPTVERQEKDYVKKNKPSKRRRYTQGVRAKKDESPQHMEVDVVCSSATRIDDSSGINTISDCDKDTSVADDEGLFPEQEVSLDADGRQARDGVKEDSSEGSSGGIKPKPRKRLKLEECDASSTYTMSDDISDFSDDSDNVCDNSPFTCSSLVSSSVAQKELTPSAPFDHEDITSSGDCVLSTTDDKMEISHSPEKFQTEQNDCIVECDKLDVSEHLVEAIGNSEDPLAISSPSSTGDNTTGNSSLSCLQSASKDVESLEELKAAAEEIFMSEWDDDDDWWEEESCSGQSSFPSSGETASSRSTVTSPGFTKCSDLYSVAELKNKLQATSEQPKTCTAAAVDNVQQFEFDDNKMPASVNQSNFTPETTVAIEEDETDEEDDVPEAMKLKFCLSLYTERVYLYDEHDSPLGINFCMSDVKNCNTEDLPSILHHHENLRQVKRLLETWKRMGEGKKRILRKSALVFDDPLQAYECARKGMSRESSYVRHPSKESQIQNVIDTAEEVGGKVRVVKKPKIPSKKRNRRTDRTGETNSGQPSSTPPLSGSATSTNTTQLGTSSKAPRDTTCYQAVRADGIPLCLFCKSPVEFVENIKCSEWDARFCSYDCKREYQVRVSGTAARRALFESERGICQLCFLDAHTLYQSIIVLNVRDRPAFLAQTPYSSLPQQMLKKMVMEPKEGMFWEADHITPVSEGGGECGLDNYRTLCIMCHRKATEELNRRLKQRKCLQYAAGYADISTFFRPLS